MRTQEDAMRELTEFELDAIAGGSSPFSINIAATLSAVAATVHAALANASTNDLANLVDNSINVA
jgi:hypothetical protein